MGDADICGGFRYREYELSTVVVLARRSLCDGAQAEGYCSTGGRPCGKEERRLSCRGGPQGATAWPRRFQDKRDAALARCIDWCARRAIERVSSSWRSGRSSGRRCAGATVPGVTIVGCCTVCRRGRAGIRMARANRHRRSRARWIAGGEEAEGEPAVPTARRRNHGRWRR